MAYSDLKGLAVSTSSSEALHAYERGLDLFLRWRGGAMDALNAAVKADPRFVLAHCARALIAWRMGQVAVASSAHQEVMALADHARDEREHLHVQTVDALLKGDRENGPGAAGAHVRGLPSGSPDGPQRRPELHRPGRLRGRHLDLPPQPRRGPRRAAVHDHAGVLPRAVGLQRRRPGDERALAGTRPDQPLHVPRGGPRLSGAGGLSQGPRDVRARGLARALRPHPLASRRGPKHPRLRAVHARLLGLHDARLAGARARGAALAPRDAAAHPDRRRGLEGACRGGRAATGARRCLDPVDASLDRSGLRPRRGDVEGGAAGRLPATACPKDVRAGTGPRRARTSSKGNSRSSGATRREPCS